MDTTQRLCLRVLEKESNPMNTSQISDFINIDISRCQKAIATLHRARKIHIAKWSMPMRVRMYIAGEGADAPEPPSKTPVAEKSKWESQNETLNEERAKRRATTMERRESVKGSVWEMVI